MNLPKLGLVCFLLTLLFPVFSAGAAGPDPFLGRWALSLRDGGAGWLEVTREQGWIDASILWGGGSVMPVASVIVDGDTLIFTRLHKLKREDAEGKVVREQVLTETLTGRVEAGALKLTRVMPHRDSLGFTTESFWGERIPRLGPRPNLEQVKFGEPIILFNGRDLAGWRLVNNQHKPENGWKVANGTLAIRPPAGATKEQFWRYGDLRTEQDFEDFNLRLEVKVPEHGNSGVFLRGIYEVQVVDSHGKTPDSHHMGAIYSRLIPTVAAEKPAGEWQTLDITLVDRYATVILNGVRIIDNQPLTGCTGGALWADQFRPGPIYLQVHDGTVEYRNLMLRPVLSTAHK